MFNVQVSETAQAASKFRTTNDLSDGKFSLQVLSSGLFVTQSGRNQTKVRVCIIGEPTGTPLSESMLGQQVDIGFMMRSDMDNLGINKGRERDFQKFLSALKSDSKPFFLPDNDFRALKTWPEFGKFYSAFTQSAPDEKNLLPSAKKAYMDVQVQIELAKLRVDVEVSHNVKGWPNYKWSEAGTFGFDIHPPAVGNEDIPFGDIPFGD